MKLKLGERKSMEAYFLWLGGFGQRNGKGRGVKNVICLLALLLGAALKVYSNMASSIVNKIHVLF